MTATPISPIDSLLSRSSLAGSFMQAPGPTDEELQQILGADWLIYQDLDDLVWAVQDGNEDLKQFDTSCFSGEYVTGVEPTYLSELEFARSDEAKLLRRQAS